MRYFLYLGRYDSKTYDSALLSAEFFLNGGLPPFIYMIYKEYGKCIKYLIIQKDRKKINMARFVPQV
jgi:hypothetical protein